MLCLSHATVLLFEINSQVKRGGVRFSDDRCLVVNIKMLRAVLEGVVDSMIVAEKRILEVCEA